MNTQLLTRLSGAAALLLLGVSALPATAAAQGSIAASWQASAFDAREAPRLWTRGGSVDPAASTLIAILRRAHLDGMAANEMVARDVERAIASGDLDAAEQMLSSAWVHYVQTLRRPVDVGMVYGDPSLAPAAPSAAAILAEAEAAPSLKRHLESVAAVNPVYAQLREGLAAREAAAGSLAGDKLAQALRINLDRARMLPSSGRYILVDAAAARLFMYEDGAVQGSMKVIVGKTEDPTPMLASRVNRAVVNPYWNVPPDLVRKRVAPAVLKQGKSYIAQQNYELLSGWEADAVPIDPDQVDWAAVADGRQELRVRQRPGPGNGMGDIKFMFPNKFGVYLHDTPDKSLFAKADRNLSAGCVRLSEPARLAKWLFGEMPRASSSEPEQSVALETPVPVFITYLTAVWDGQKVVQRADVYGRDRVASSLMAASD